ncbi:NAD(P)-binding protein [Mailhella massiliensis]|uniref:NAD(P)-binding protein n=1 Tax=Mailhella massiliensis TaxID=1903261 RepID=A0A921AUT8_9BACT|nr:NAD(P)-binding protein [Mailhella massiliensis]HJD96476.1 NAD(P)-binding protein [Mailhella massiliensis]
MNDSNIAIDTTLCLACGNCVDRCIMDNLRLSLPPCRQASPLGVNYQGIARLLSSGKEEEAARELRRSTPFGGLLSALSDPYAEKACSLGQSGGALRFADLLRYLVAAQPGIVYGAETNRLPSSSKKAAVIGAGPAGLQAAWILRMSGADVTVFEAAPEAGMTLTRIPAEEAGENDALPAVPAEIMEKTLAMLQGAGIHFLTSCPKGQAELESLCTEYDAVLCACGKGAVLPADKNGYVKDNLFAAGTCVKNQKSLSPLQAMASASKAAHAARNLLEGFDIDYESDERTARGLERFAGLGDREIAEVAPVTPASKLYTEEEARAEASRCLGCGRPYERNKTCWYCLPCEVVCPTQALHVRIPYLIR